MKKDKYLAFRTDEARKVRLEEIATFNGLDLSSLLDLAVEDFENRIRSGRPVYFTKVFNVKIPPYLIVVPKGKRRKSSKS